MKNIQHYRYEIDSNNALSIWDDSNPIETGEPFFYQPDKPDSTPWTDYAEVENFAIDKINDFLEAEEKRKLQESIAQEEQPTEEIV